MQMQRSKFVVDLEVEEPIDAHTALMLVREALGEYVSARGAGSRMSVADGGVERYVAHRYNNMSDAYRADKIESVMSRSRIVRNLRDAFDILEG